MPRILISLTLLLCLLSGCTGDPPLVGSAAPEFRLTDQNGDWHQLSEYRGRWLAIYFYPQNGTPGCTTEACNFRDNMYQFQAIGAEVVGISLDDVESHKAFATEHRLPFTLLSDAGGQVSEHYGVLRNFLVTQMASRQSFLVSPDGVIVKHYADVDPDVHSQEVLADIAAFQQRG